MLPEDFRWVQQVGATGPEHRAWLYVGKAKAVALVAQTIHGQWYTLVNRHRPPKFWRRASCAGQAQGRLWVERWACAHAERLREEPSDLDAPDYWEARGGWD